jgi:sec-independent protein translocase protein TatA
MHTMVGEMLLGFGLPGNWEWVIIAMIALLLFGSRLPQVARSVGDGIREFKKGLKDVADEAKDPPRRDPPKSPLPPKTSDGEDARVPHGAAAEGDNDR